jgi:branched-chain amino acid transport system ATP-binding protein
MSEPILLVDKITAGYDRQQVLRNISLEVPDGSAVGIIGPNGHGKSTLLKCISNLIRPFHGTIQFKGKSTIGLRPEKIVEIGITHIPQGDLLFPKLTVLENLRMGAYLSFGNREEVNKRRNQVYEIFPRLREREYQLASTLSGGERRMLSIGRGLMTEGSVLLIDEPSLGLAPMIIEQIYEVLTELKKRNIALLIVEENPTRVARIADYIYLLDHGEFVWHGTPHALRSQSDILHTYFGT